MLSEVWSGLLLLSIFIVLYSPVYMEGVVSLFPKVLTDLDIQLRPNSVVGRRYVFAAQWNGKQIVIRGFVSQFLWRVAGNLHYVAEGEEGSPVTVFGLIYQKSEWRLQARLQHSVMYLPGTFEFV